MLASPSRLPSFRLVVAFWVTTCALPLGICLADKPLDFVRDVRPILSEYCFQCHGPDAATREADLRLDVEESARSVIDVNAEGTSPLLERITSEDPDLQMPPATSVRQLSASQKEILLRWLAGGGSYETHWAFRVPSRPALPPEVAQAWCRNPVDAFVLRALAEEQLAPSPPTDAETLLRRLCFDLTGLPASGELRETFLAAAQQRGLSAAADALIDQLMASPSYAEHMALPWLEAARYADTDGYQNDRYRYQHAWRDWVLRAFNEKMPYDQFVIEQLAGDMLPEATLWQQVASGFGRNHRINSEDGSIPEEWRVENVVDRVDTFGTVFLGMTLGCARCHDHKYDPISQRDYYRLFAYFNNIAEHGVGPNNGNSPPFVELPVSWPLLSPDEDRAIVPDPVALRAARKDSGNGLQRPQAGSPKTVMVMHELEQPRETYLLLRGQYNAPDRSELLSGGVPGALNAGRGDGDLPQDRLELARWLVDGNNPLTARVAVNRLWQHFWGVGLVETSENFGSQGTPASHPDLLDWLACELVDSGWDLQHVQRLILRSAAYRQSSITSETEWERDPKNRWLGRYPRRRLPAFSLRDQALEAAGLLVRATGGPSVKPYMPEKIWSSISNNKYEQQTGQNLYRRSLYTYWRRTIPPPTMMNFNAAAREVCTVRTQSTNTPLQALTLLNNKTFVEAARCLAERMTLATDDLDGRLRFGFQRVVARLPRPAELLMLKTAYQHFLQAYRQAPESEALDVLSVGEAPRNESLAPAEQAALTMTASLMLNLDEAITQE